MFLFQRMEKRIERSRTQLIAQVTKGFADFSSVDWPMSRLLENEELDCALQKRAAEATSAVVFGRDAPLHGVISARTPTAAVRLQRWR